MKICFETAEQVMEFIEKAEELFGTERPVSYQYMSYMIESIEHIRKQIRFKPEVYERALRDLKPRMSEEMIENAKVKYFEFEKYYNSKKQEQSFNL